MAIKTWTGAGADNNWTTGGNWSGGTAPTTGAVDDIVFDGVAPNGNKIVCLTQCSMLFQ